MTQGFAREARIGVDLHVGETLYYTANDTFAKADYPGLYGVRVKVQGAGGGGAGCASTTASQASGGGGGGSGAYAEAIVVAADLSTSESITVGAGGAGGVGQNDGSTGGASSFGTHAVAGAGAGGADITARATHAMPAGGVGGVATAGDVQSDGSPGDRAILLEGVTGAGGNGGVAHLGGSGLGGANADGQVGGDFGGGGGGAGNNPSQVARDGGAGADGIVIVEVLYERKIAVDEDIHTQYLHKTNDVVADISDVDAWQTYSPTLTNMTQGNGTITARYAQIGKTTFVHFEFLLGSTSAMGTNPQFSLPAAIHGSHTVTRSQLGLGTALDAGTASYICIARNHPDNSTANINYQRVVGSFIQEGTITSTVPFTWTTNDLLTISLSYEAA